MHHQHDPPSTERTHLTQSARDPLAEPLRLPCGTTLSNRLVKAAMSEQLAEADGTPSDRLIRLYDAWADSGCGLLITGNMMVDRRAISEPRQVVVEPGIPLDRLAAVAAAAKRSGAATWAQLNHGGRQVPRYLSRHVTAPSPVQVRTMGAFSAPRALGEQEVWDVVERFATAAALVMEAGFDGVQIHAAHGYLLSQFLSPLTNQRDDTWGGDPGRRARLLLEVVRAVRGAVGTGVPVAVKVNSADFQRGGGTEEDSLAVVRALGSEVDLIEISGGTFESGAMMGPRGTQLTRDREAYFHRFAELARDTTAVPLMLTGGFRTPAAMRAAVADGTVDAVGLARPFVVEPTFAARMFSDGAAPIDLPPRQLGSKKLDALAEVAWYTCQLRRIGAGQEPDPTMRTGTALAAYLATTIAQAATRPRRSARSQR